MSHLNLPGEPDYMTSLATDAYVDVLKSATFLARRLKPTERKRLPDPSLEPLSPGDGIRISAEEQALRSFGTAWAQPALATMLEGHMIGQVDLGIAMARQQLETDALIGGRSLELGESPRLPDALQRIAEEVTKGYTVNPKPDAEAVARLRSQFTAQRLEAITRTAHAAATFRERNPGGFATLADQLRRQVNHKHRKIEPPDLDRRPEVPIEELYTPQVLQPDASFRTGYLSAVTTTQFVAQLRRAVVLGTPGGGKSTLTRYACFELTREEWSPTVRRPIPLYVTLRKWNPDDRSVLDQLYVTASRFYQVELPEDFLEVLLGAGLVLPVFDGLDEVLDLAGRRAMIAAIDTFHNRYPLVSTLVSSRYIGYEQAMLAQEDFDVMVLSEFNAAQVADYSTRWFTYGAGLPATDASATAESFLLESRSVADVRSNPLLLALMCILYRGHRYIPQNRPQLYEECARLLFRDWDLHRGIRLKFPFESLVDDCVQHLAHWIFGNKDREKGVPEKVLIDEAQAYFLEWLYTDRVKARAAAKEFVEYCRGRAWILSATGSTARAANVFQFTHRTFLEHFAGTYLSRTAESPAALAEVLAGRVGDPQWDVVSQVALYRQKEDHRGAADTIINTLLNHADVAPDQQWAREAVSFLARGLAIVVPKPAIVSRLVWRCLDLDLAALDAATHHSYESAPSVGANPLIAPMLDNARPENSASVQDGVLRWLTAQLREPYGMERGTALLGTISEQAESANGLWPDTVSRCRPLLKAEAQRRAQDSPEAALNLVASGLLPPSKMLESHGLQVLFTNYRDWAGRWQPALGPRMVVDAFTSERRAAYIKPILGELVATVRTGIPLHERFTVRRQDLRLVPRPAFWIPVEVGGVGADDAIAGLVLLCCIWEEVANAAGVDGALAILGSESLADLDGVKHALERRASDGWAAVDGIRSIGLPEDVESLVIDWAEHRVDFLREVHVSGESGEQPSGARPSTVTRDAPQQRSVIDRITSRLLGRDGDR